ncbi:hypothetical protein ACTD5D_32165 [Nocardia takedensis]|uniref:hypothetical protein n=1 Tax=Nocardia takedensis TaxID=259390 RepID=UPI003F77056B
MGNTIYLDVETTGLHLRRRPWEIALIAETGDRDQSGAPIHRTLVLQITDVDISDAQPQALEISRFYERHVGHAQIPGRVVVQINADEHNDIGELADHLAGDDWDPVRDVLAVDEATAAGLVAVWTAGADIVGLNTAFDVATLSWMLDRHGLNPEPWDYHITNVAQEAAAWYRGMLQAALDNPNNPLDDRPGPVAAVALIEHTLAKLASLPRNTRWLSDLCGVALPGPDEYHTALGDARWVQRWWAAIGAGVGRG